MTAHALVVGQAVLEQVGKNITNEVKAGAVAILICVAIGAFLMHGGQQRVGKLFISFAVIIVISWPILNSDGFVNFLTKISDQVFKGV